MMEGTVGERAARMVWMMTAPKCEFKNFDEYTRVGTRYFRYNDDIKKKSV
jgi:hypothetical protein